MVYGHYIKYLIISVREPYLEFDLETVPAVKGLMRILE